MRMSSESDAQAAARYARRARAAADYLRAQAEREAAEMDRAMAALRRRQGGGPSR